ncbi:uncharacterized protein PRCAT00004575001 [Priceomyces carsonii]|uniref:uncharacterized protein n=1 Tax=Priceomyces carsonii TaxID=28549 RepID=UPI002ED86F52|nr:unnamed protein product [Priceomyces carsonii]
MASNDHIAIIVCDTPIEGVYEKFGDFGDNVESLLDNAGGSPFPCVKYQLKLEDEITLKDIYSNLWKSIEQGNIKGIIFTGSRSDSFAKGVMWIDMMDHFIKGLLKEHGLPIVGICFGHQIICKNLNCIVGRNDPEIGWENGTTEIQMNKEVLTSDKSPFKSFFNDKDARLNLTESHLDIVHGIPETFDHTEFLCIGSTSKCAVQGILTKSGPVKILTFQGHPEFTAEISLSLLERSFHLGKIDEAVFRESTRKTEETENQGVLAGKVIVNFLKLHNC